MTKNLYLILYIYFVLHHDDISLLFLFCMQKKCICYVSKRTRIDISRTIEESWYSIL